MENSRLIATALFEISTSLGRISRSLDLLFSRLATIDGSEKKIAEAFNEAAKKIEEEGHAE